MNSELLYFFERIYFSDSILNVKKKQQCRQKMILKHSKGIAHTLQNHH